MEIEFNPSRVPQPEYTPPVTRTSGPPPASAPAESTETDSLSARLQQVPLVRPDKVNESKTLAADEKYPPNDVLDRIAILLAIRLKG